jgi:hypothetical protein
VGVLSQLAGDEDEFIIRDVAANLNTPVEVLKQLVGNTDKSGKDENVRKEIAGNPNTPAEILKELAKDGWSRIRSSVAGNPNTSRELSLELFKQLAGDEDKSIRSREATNPNIPVEMLKQLARDRDEDVRKEAASNPNMPAELRIELFKQLAKKDFARKGIAGNPNTPAEILKELAKDGWSRIREEVARNPNTPTEVLKELAETVLLDSSLAIRDMHSSVASNPNTPRELMKQLAERWWSMVTEDESERRRGGATFVPVTIAKNRNTPVEVLQQLSGDEFKAVRKWVANNPNTSLETLVSLALDKDHDVRENVSEVLLGGRYPTFGQWGRLPLVLSPEQQSCISELARPVLLQAYTKGSQPSLPRLIAMLHPECPVPALAKHFRSSDWRERCAIAQNPSTPPKTLSILACECNRVVRAAAKENLERQ